MSWWNSLSSGVSNYFSSGSGWSDLLGGVMAGIGGAAQASREGKENAQNHEWALALAALQGDQARRTTAFEAELKDYYDQRDKHNKRVALDTYGQFSVMDRRSPGYVPPQTPAAPTKPSLESYNG